MTRKTKFKEAPARYSWKCKEKALKLAEHTKEASPNQRVWKSDFAWSHQGLAYCENSPYRFFNGVSEMPRI